MTKIDNSKAILDGVFSDVTISVPAKTTYQAYTVLGLNSSGKLTAFTSDNNVKASEGVSEFIAEPSYILAHQIENTTGSPVEYPLARVLECGVVDANKVVFIKEADAENQSILTMLKNNGIHLAHIDYAN